METVIWLITMIPTSMVITGIGIFEIVIARHCRIIIFNDTGFNLCKISVDYLEIEHATGGFLRSLRFNRISLLGRGYRFSRSHRFCLLCRNPGICIFRGRF